MTTNKWKFQSTSLETTLVMWFVLISFIPLLIVSSISYYNSRSTITKEVQERLKLNTSVETTYLQTFAKRVLSQLNIITTNKNNIDFIKTVTEAFQQSGKSSEIFIDSYEWIEIVDEKQREFQEFLTAEGFYDILFFDVQGNLLFSVQENDNLGINIFSEEHSTTLLSKAITDVLQKGGSVFSDFEHYPYAKDSLSAFFVKDMISDLGQRVGFTAIHINSSDFKSSVVDENGSRMNLSSYLIGEDLKLRFGLLGTLPYLGKNQDMEIELRCELYKSQIIQKENADYYSEKVLSYVDNIGRDILRLHTHLQISDKNFILVTEIAKENAYEDVVRLRNITLGMTFLLVFFVIMFAVKIARHIVIPVKELSRSVIRVASGNFDEVIEIKSDNEIGILAQNYNSMVGDLKQTMQTMENEILKRRILEKKANQTLKTNREILENMPVGVVIVGKDKRIRFMNNAGLEMIKVDSAEKIIGSICHNNICPAQEGKCPIYDLDQTVDKSEKKLLTGDHEEIPILKTCIPIVLDGEKVLLETFIDITERKIFEHQLEENLNNISEANQRLEVLVSNTTEREKRMVLLKQEVNDLLSQSGQKHKYEAPKKIKEQNLII